MNDTTAPSRISTAFIDDKGTTTIQVSADIRRRLRVLCAEKNIAFSTLITALLYEYLDENGRAEGMDPRYPDLVDAVRER